MSSEPKDIQVIIAGGGPSGAATALSLASRGIKCLVAEAAPTPQFKAGETIPPNALVLFRKLGIAHLLESPQHLHSYGNRFVWGSAIPEDKTFIFTRHPNGWHIERRFFEQQLQEATRKAGACWHSGTRITDCTKEGNSWKVTLRNEAGALQQIDCDFIADASGRPSRIARSMGIRRHRVDNLTGITVCINTTDSNCPLYTFIETQPTGWWYAAPLSGSRIVTTFMTDADLLDPSMLKIEIYMQALQTTDMIRELIANAVITGYSEPAIQAASTSYLQRRHGQSWLAAGDAAISYDPISSYGITSALERGYYAGHAVADTLSGMQDALTAYEWLLCNAFTTYKEMHTHQYQLEKRWACEEFWKRRCASTTPNYSVE